MTRVLVLNGPNLGRLGSREPEIYGYLTLSDVATTLSEDAPEGVEVELRQTDDEGEMIRWLHEAADTSSPVVLNPAAFTHYSYGLRDAVAVVVGAGVPVIEIHLSNPHSREEFRHTSVLSGVATGVIAGLSIDSYRLGLVAALRRA